jgi:hypothetical protein
LDGLVASFIGFPRQAAIIDSKGSTKSLSVAGGGIQSEFGWWKCPLH